jgi:uroporphyrinogen decarboxylase
MTSKERMYNAIKKKPTDRIPVFMWFHPDTKTVLADYLEIPESGLDFAFGNDVKQIWVNNNYAMEGIVHERDGDTHTDDWGIEWMKKYSFNQIKSYPLVDASREGVCEYKFPYHKLEKLFKPMHEVAETAEGYFLGCDISPCAFEMYWRLRGMENTLIDFAEDYNLAEKMIKRCADFSISLGEEAIRRFDLDWLWTGDDVASQDGMIFSPKLWRQLIKPQLARIFRIAKSRNLYVAYHCCGSLRPIIPDLIEIGMDVLNPVQSLCPGMDAFELKREFGDSVTFMGGVDTQYLLPKGTVSQVHKATAGLIEGMTIDGGGYILAATHTVPPETPLANIFAMYNEAGITEEEIRDRSAKLRK